MSIEIPDWVVQRAYEAWREAATARKGNKPSIEAAIRAALEGWLEPRGYLITWDISGEQLVSARPAHQDDGTTETLYVLRKDKTP